MRVHQSIYCINARLSTYTHYYILYLNNVKVEITLSYWIYWILMKYISRNHQSMFFHVLLLLSFLELETLLLAYYTSGICLYYSNVFFKSDLSRLILCDSLIRVYGIKLIKQYNTYETHKKYGTLYTWKICLLCTYISNICSYIQGDFESMCSPIFHLIVNLIKL